jgi:hypothetical protein
VESAVPPREYLARALAACGDPNGASGVFGRVLETRALFWVSSDTLLPGVWADTLFQRASIASSLGRAEEARRAALEYLKIRGGADAPAPELASARKMAGFSSNQ